MPVVTQLGTSCLLVPICDSVSPPGFAMIGVATDHLRQWGGGSGTKRQIELKSFPGEDTSASCHVDQPICASDPALPAELPAPSRSRKGTRGRRGRGAWPDLALALEPLGLLGCPSCSLSNRKTLETERSSGVESGPAEPPSLLYCTMFLGLLEARQKWGSFLDLVMLCCLLSSANCGASFRTILVMGIRLMHHPWLKKQGRCCYPVALVSLTWRNIPH